MIYVISIVVFQRYRDLEAGDNQSLKIQVARPGIERRSSCSASQELNHSATAAPQYFYRMYGKYKSIKILAAIRGIHVLPAKHRYEWLPRKCDYQTDGGETGAGQSDPYDTGLCATMLRRRYKNRMIFHLCNTNLLSTSVKIKVLSIWTGTIPYGPKYSVWNHTFCKNPYQLSIKTSVPQ